MQFVVSFAFFRCQHSPVIGVQTALQPDASNAFQHEHATIVSGTRLAFDVSDLKSVAIVAADDCGSEPLAVLFSFFTSTRWH